MIEITDTNKWLKPPAGYELDSFDARGAYLCARYKQRQVLPDAQPAIGFSIVEIFLNEDGREVARTKWFETFTTYAMLPPLPVTRRQRFIIGWRKVWIGLQEVLSCLQKQSVK